MGQRANYIIISDGVSEIYYDHWGGDKAPSLLIAGFADCIAEIRKYTREGWLMDKLIKDFIAG